MKSAEYGRRVRTKRRKKAQLATRRLRVAIPEIMGRYTMVFAALARHGTLRRSDLEQAFSTAVIGHLQYTDRLGLTSSWRVGRFWFVGFNPAFPYLREVRRLLTYVSEGIDFGIEPATTKAEAVVPEDAARPVNPDYLLGQVVRTKTLAALQVLGGKSPTKTSLLHAPPGHSVSYIDLAVKRYAKLGMIESNSDFEVTFAYSNPLVRAFLPLLKRYVADHPGFAEKVRSRHSLQLAASESRMEWTFFGRSAYERQMLELAVSGPASRNRLFARALTKNTRTGTIEMMIDAGVVVEERRGMRTIIGLNRAHPIFRELRDLLLAMQGLTEGGGSLDMPRKSYSVEHLLEIPVRLHVLLGIVNSPGEECDAAALGRICSQFGLQSVPNELRIFSDLGVLTSRDENGMTFYRLDESCGYSRQLHTLLARINQVWPPSAGT